MAGPADDRDRAGAQIVAQCDASRRAGQHLSGRVE